MTDQVVHGVHEYDDDPRNDAVLVHVNGKLERRSDAVVSVFGLFAMKRGGVAAKVVPDRVRWRGQRPRY